MRKLRLFLVFAFLGMFSLVGAQTISFSVKGGLNMSNMYGDDLPDTKMKLGFNAGVGADFGFTPNMFLQTGLFYSTKGAKLVYDETPRSSDNEVTINANYLQLPVHFAYKMDVTPGTKIVLHGGPYVAYGIGGKIKGGEGSSDTFEKEYGLNPLDVGAGLGVGAEFGNILIDLGWDMGLINISRDNEGTAKTQNAYLTVGYRF